VDCTIFSVEMSETALEIGQTKTILRSDMRDKGGAGVSILFRQVARFAMSDRAVTLA
jgi:hypothetical protein